MIMIKGLMMTWKMRMNFYDRDDDYRDYDDYDDRDDDGRDDDDGFL